jgi:hypothetical protein
MLTASKSEEDLQLKSELEMLVERLKEPDTSLYLPPSSLCVR